MNATELQRQQLIDDIRTLPEEGLKEAAEIVARWKLKQRLGEGEVKKYESQASLQEVARLPINKRHQLLAQQVTETAEDFAANPSLTEFSELDIENWNADNVEA